MPNGIIYKRSASGKPISVTIDLKKHGALFEDFLDRLEIKRNRTQPKESLQKVIARIDKKHGIKRSH